jgi:hypothetical protein
VQAVLALLRQPRSAHARLHGAQVWLLEVNGSPACAERMVAAFAEDLKEAVLDPALFGALEASEALRADNLFERISVE